MFYELKLTFVEKCSIMAVMHEIEAECIKMTAMNRIVRWVCTVVVSALPLLVVFALSNFLGRGGSGNALISEILFACIAISLSTLLILIGSKSKDRQTLKFLLFTLAGGTIVISAALYGIVFLDLPAEEGHVSHIPLGLFALSLICGFLSNYFFEKEVT